MQKPEAILFYNANKSGVDCMDQMVTHFTTKRPTKRWTLAFFFNMLDVMALAAFVACKEIDGNYKHDGRRKFLNMLANTMVLANTENRMNQISVVTQFSTQMAMVGFYGRRIDLPTNVVTEQRSGANTLTTRKDCRICRQECEKLRRETRFYCADCNQPVCQQHSKIDYHCFACTSENQQ